MKVTIIDRTAQQALTDDSNVSFIPDSALLLCGKPFFIPELPGPWSVSLYLAFRISRLGKTIAPKFAHRYYDAVAIAAKTSSPAVDPVIINSMDGALALGQWVTFDPLSPLSVNFGDQSITLTLEQTEIDNAIARLSRFMTFKMGDILLPLKIATLPQINIGDHIEAGVQNQKSLDFNIK